MIMFISILSTVSANDGNVSNSAKLETTSNTINTTQPSTTPSTNTNNISKSTIKSSNYVAYIGVKNPYKVVLSTNNSKLSNRTIKFVFKGKKYYKKTNKKGEATLYITLKKKGNYSIKYYYNGEKYIKSSKGSSKIYVRKGMPTYIKKNNSITYFSKISSPFKVKLINKRGTPLSNKKIIFKINKKTYTRKTNKQGIASINIKLKKGTYKINYYFKKTSIYKGTYITSKIYVKPYYKTYIKNLGNKNTGIWLKSKDMNYINLNTLSKNGIKHIFLNSEAMNTHGKANIEKFISKAKSKGIKTHIWMQTFYINGWIKPTTKSGAYNYTLFNSKIKLAKQYASLKGVSGIHLDYLRFPGTAYQYTNGINAINYFTKKCAYNIRLVNSKCIVSAAVMPESMESLKKYYGQDIPTLSKDLDVIIPMAYKGNYGKNSKWIKNVSNNFVKNSKGAKIWTGLQTYKSDNNLTKLSVKELFNDCKNALNGESTGIILFRHGLINYMNFTKLFV